MIRIGYGPAAVIVIWASVLWLAHSNLNHPAMVLVPLPQPPAPVIETVRVVKCAEPVKITAPLPKSATYDNEWPNAASIQAGLRQWSRDDRKVVQVMSPHGIVIYMVKEKQ